MSLRPAADAALVWKHPVQPWLVVAILGIVLAGLSISCGDSSKSSTSHNAYVTLPNRGSVALLRIDDSSGAIRLISQTPAVTGTSPTGIALDSSGNFLFVGNAEANTVSAFSIGGDGVLTQSGDAIAVGAGPRSLVIDPSGKYLLITNSLGNNVSVYSVSSGALTLVGDFPSDLGPGELKFTPSGAFVYVSSSSTGFISAYAFNSTTGNLAPVPGSPFPSGGGVSGMAIDGSGRFLFAANTSDGTGTVSVFTIDGNGALHPISGSPFAAGTAPRALTLDSTNAFLYVANQQSNNVSAFSVNATTGALTAVSGSPFNAGTEPIFVLAEPAGGYIYVGNQKSTNVSSYSYDTSTGKLTAVSGSPFSVGAGPGGMVVAH